MATKAQQQLIEAMKAALENGWEAAGNEYGPAVRWRETRDTPDIIRYGNDGGIGEWSVRPIWPHPNYDVLVWVMLPGRRPLIRVSRASWVGTSTREATFKAAHAALLNPGEVVD